MLSRRLLAVLLVTLTMTFSVAALAMAQPTAAKQRRGTSLAFTVRATPTGTSQAARSGDSGVRAGREHQLIPVAPVPEAEPALRETASFARLLVPECWDAGQEIADCLPSEPAEGEPAPAPPTRQQVEGFVRTLVARLRLPDAVPQVGPAPGANEWNMAVVGHPLWLWIDGPDQLATSVSGYGITIRMDAQRNGLSFNMGDGSIVRCTTMTPYSDSVVAGAPSPTCGYTYEVASLPKGNYAVSATAHWAVDWSALGYSGTIPMDITDTTELPVGELQAVVVRR